MNLLSVFLCLIAIAGARGGEDRPAIDLAREDLDAGRVELAVGRLHAHLESHPRDDDARVLLGWAEYRAGRFEAAGAVFADVLARHDGHPDASIGLGYVRLQVEGPAEAASIFRAALASRPGDADAMQGLVHAATRREADDALAAEGLEVATRLLESRPDDLDLTYDLVRLERRAGGRGERRIRPESVGGDPEVHHRAGRDYLETRSADGRWEPVFVRGFNLGTALPGEFPTGFPTDPDTYRGWLGTMAGLGANVVRVYTLLPPAFYRALDAHNRESAGAPLRLIQGVWAELPDDHDFEGAVWQDGFRGEIARVFDAVHGNLVLAPRPGHASGIYDADASPWLLAWIVGREWEPFAVRDFVERGPGAATWRGRWFEVEGGNAMEVWVAENADWASGYEAARYGSLHPIAFANWPTLDPLDHPTEATRAEEDAWRRRRGEPYHERLAERPWEDDAVAVDMTKIRPTESMRAGFFASYHVYPNFPDFLNLDPAYASARDAEGSSRYAGYLRALKARHGDQPVMIAEFGISTSRGIAHLQPQGWHHGGHDERRQGELVARMLRSIRDARCAGGIVFEFLDEWFKRTWSVAPFEIPDERRPLWFNAESPEQSYGILAARPAAPVRVDGDPAEWPAGATIWEGRRGPRAGWAGLRRVAALSDEGYVYLLIETAGGGRAPDPGRVAWRIAIDTYDAGRGERDLPPPGAARAPTGVEFLVDLAGAGADRVRVTAPYEAQAGRERGPFASPRAPSGRFVPLTFETNRERIGRDGTLYPAQRVDRGCLRRGTLDPGDPAFDTRTDLAVGIETGAIEVRLPWGLLNVTDPSSHRVLHQEEIGAQPFSTARTDGFRFVVYAIDPSRPESAPVAVAPARGAALWTWPSWERPQYVLELKAGAGAIGEAMRGASPLREAVDAR